MNDYTEADECKAGDEEPAPMERKRQRRAEMLEKLHTVKFRYIWPGNWKDIGFTEREIWVNSKGYGYVMCDEPNGTIWSGEGLNKAEWKNIRKKLKKEILEFQDIQGTCLENALNSLYFFGYHPDDDFCEPNQVLKSLLELPNGPVGTLYAAMAEDGPVFFDNEEDFRRFYERNWCDYAWDDLEDDILELWMERLFGVEE